MSKNTFTLGGNTFAINFTMYVVDQLAKVGVSACNPGDLEHLCNLYANRLKLAEALWTCIKRKAKDAGIESQEQFEELLDGDALSAGFDALIEGFVLFAPTDVRPAMWQAIAEFRRIVKSTADEFTAELTAEPAAA